MMIRLYSVLCADVVESTSLDLDSMANLRRIFDDSFADIRTYLKADFWGRLVKGDYVECCCNSLSDALRIAMILKCRLKWWAEAFDCGSNKFKSYGLRFSIGIGRMRIIDPSSDIMDGEAIYAAGRGLSKIGGTEMTSCFAFVNADDAVESLIDNNITFIDECVNAMSARQCAVIYYKLLGLLERDISEMLRLSQPAVNMRAKLASWALIQKTLKVFDDIDYGRYVL